jgi:DNA-binding XRE family transcriptional regulator
VLQKGESGLTILCMDKLQAIERAGTATALARLLGITRQAIYQWGDELPTQRYWQLKVLRPEWFTNL